MPYKKKNRKSRIAAKVVYIAIIIILLAVATIIAIGKNSPVQSNIPYLTLNEVNETIPNASYVQVRASSMVNFSSVLRNEGYVGASVSVFNLTKVTSNDVPYVISSSLFLMSGPKAANSTLESLIFSNNANQSVRGFIYNGTIISNSTYSKVSVHFYTVSSVAVYNTSIINNALSAHENFTMPVFQSTTLFNYEDYVGTVVVDSYAYSPVMQNDSVKLAELLVGRLASAH